MFLWKNRPMVPKIAQPIFFAQIIGQFLLFKIAHMAKFCPIWSLWLSSELTPSSKVNSFVLETGF
jgi:hypothetical protein